jgi:hypothetical protein
MARPPAPTNNSTALIRSRSEIFERVCLTRLDPPTRTPKSPVLSTLVPPAFSCSQYHVDDFLPVLATKNRVSTWADGPAGNFGLDACANSNRVRTQLFALGQTLDPACRANSFRAVDNDIPIRALGVERPSRVWYSGISRVPCARCVLLEKGCPPSWVILPRSGGGCLPLSVPLYPSR